MLSPAQKSFWDANGYLVFQRFFGQEQIEEVNDLIESIWCDPPDNVLAERRQGHDSPRLPLADFSDEERQERSLKLNNLYANEETIRSLTLNDRLVGVLNELMGEPVVQFRSLHFEKSSSQPEHRDSIYVSAPTPGKLLATYIALENSHYDAGRLFYYPGSHKIPRYEFSAHDPATIAAEMPHWHSYIQGQILRGEIRREIFDAKQGDLLIFHADLVHGSSPVRDPKRTLKSMVNHYLALSDCQSQSWDCVPSEDAYWYRRAESGLTHSHHGHRGLRPRIEHWLRRLGVYPTFRRVGSMLGATNMHHQPMH